jgi:hypothetical protein
MAMQPRLWTISGVATELGWDRRTTAERCVAVQPAGRVRGHLAWYIRDVVADRPVPGAATATMAELRARKAAMDLELKQYELAEKQRTMVRIDDVMPFYERRLQALGQHLKSLPGRVAAEIDPDDPIRVQEIVDRAVRAAMEAMSTDEDPEYSDEELAPLVKERKRARK